MPACGHARGYAWLLGCLLLWWSCAAGATAAAPIRISDVARGAPVLDGTVQVWQHGPAREAPLEMAALPADGSAGFQTVTARRLQGRFDMRQLWLRLALHNDLPAAQTAQLALQVTWLQHLDFYVLRTKDGQTSWTLTRAGIADPRDERHPVTRVPQVSIEMAAGETVQVLVHADSHASKLNLALHTGSQWQQLERDHALFSGLLIGGMLIFAVYSAALWQISRVSMMAWQTLGLSLTVLYEATYRGYAHILLWPGSTEWGYRAHHVLVAGIMLCLLLYLRARLRRNSGHVPRSGLRLLQTVAGLEAVVLLGALLGPYDWFAPLGIVMAPLGTMAILACTYLYHRQGGPGGQTALLIMLIICACALLRMAALILPDIPSVQFFEQYALVMPGLMVGLFAVTSWSYQQSRQRRHAQRALLQWQDQQQQRLEQEVQRKTHALGEALLQAEQRAQEQKELLAYVSHDLRAPVSAIIGNLRLLAADAPGAGSEKLAAIERSATYQLALIDELVDYAKEELMPPLALKERPTPLRMLLNDLAQYAQALASRQRNAFTLQVQGALPEAVQLDGKRLQQVVLNLLSNAAKFTRDGHIRLSLWAEPLGGHGWRLHFEVEDSGAGIAQAELERMAHALAQNTPHAKGGLGLLIAQRIVQKMQGRLILESRLGAGTRAAFSLAVRQVPGSAMLHFDTAQASPAAGAQAQPARPPLPALSPHQKQQLETLAAQGSWSDLHAWLDALEPDAHYRPLVQAVRLALDGLDFEQIRQIARAAPAR